MKKKKQKNKKKKAVKKKKKVAGEMNMDNFSFHSKRLVTERYNPA